ncbi:hypothetical protein [Nocardiopsis sp. CA-288880]|uniref:hypothetical protein n=1 Tax=Nocardiopsis sp. CA-288880 TaxID=3239995 RepID=UPI003D980D7A
MTTTFVSVDTLVKHVYRGDLGDPTCPNCTGRFVHVDHTVTDLEVHMANGHQAPEPETIAVIPLDDLKARAAELTRCADCTAGLYLAVDTKAEWTVVRGHFPGCPDWLGVTS